MNEFFQRQRRETSTWNALGGRLKLKTATHPLIYSTNKSRKGERSWWNLDLLSHFDFFSLSHVYVLNVRETLLRKKNIQTTLHFHSEIRSDDYLGIASSRGLNSRSRQLSRLLLVFGRHRQSDGQSTVIWQVFGSRRGRCLFSLQWKTKEKCRCYSHSHTCIQSVGLPGLPGHSWWGRDSAILPL